LQHTGFYKRYFDHTDGNAIRRVDVWRVVELPNIYY
jgi:hypothetical protein